MAAKTKTVIIVILAAFLLFSGVAAFLITRYIAEIRQTGPENAVFVENTVRCVGSAI